MKKNKDIIINKAKEYYINNKESIKDYQKQYRKNNPLKEDKKQKMKEYQKQYRENNPLTEDKKQKMKEKYREARKLNNKDEQNI